MDPFIGSGTIAVAAVQLGRQYVGIDLDQKYVDLARNRVAQLQMGLPGIAESEVPYSIEVTSIRQ